MQWDGGGEGVGRGEEMEGAVVEEDGRRGGRCRKRGKGEGRGDGRRGERRWRKRGKIEVEVEGLLKADIELTAYTQH